MKINKYTVAIALTIAGVLTLTGNWGYHPDHPVPTVSDHLGTFGLNLLLASIGLMILVPLLRGAGLLARKR